MKLSYFGLSLAAFAETTLADAWGAQAYENEDCTGALGDAVRTDSDTETLYINTEGMKSVLFSESARGPYRAIGCIPESIERCGGQDISTGCATDGGGSSDPKCVTFMHPYGRYFDDHSLTTYATSLCNYGAIGK